jgi:voltage-gated potassium channel
MTKQIAAHDWLRFALHLSTGIIWFAFAAEYIIMMSVTERKFEYFKKHWLDLVIILLPLVSFLRSLRFLRVTRVAKIASLERLSQMMRVYRFRGLSMRVVRALMVFNVLNRLLHSHPDKQRERLLLQIRGKEMELKELRKRLRELERLSDSSNSRNEA